MKKVFEFLFLKVVVLTVLGGIFYLIMDFNMGIVVVEGNLTRKPIPVGNNKYQDAQCGMMLESNEFAAQVINAQGKTWFFHDQGGVPLWLQQRNFQDPVIIWMFTQDSKKWLLAEQVYFSLDEETPMHYGFVAYQHQHKGFIRYQEMKQKMLRGENMLDPRIRQRLKALKKEDNHE